MTHPTARVDLTEAQRPQPPKLIVGATLERGTAYRVTGPDLEPRLAVSPDSYICNAQRGHELGDIPHIAHGTEIVLHIWTERSDG